MATNILALGQYVQQGFDQGRKQGLERRYNRLAGEAFNAPTNQLRDSAIGQIAVNNPKAANELRTQYQQQDNDQLKLLTGAARYLKGAMDTNNPQAVQGAWNTVLPGLIRRGMVKEGELSPTWDPSYEATVHQLLAMGEGASGGASGVQSTYVDGEGNRVAIMRDGSTQVLGRNDAGANQQTLTIDVNGVPTQVTFDRRTGRYTNASLGGQAVDQQVPASGMQTIGGQQVFIDPSLPDSVRSGLIQSLQSGQEPQAMAVGAPSGTPLIGRRKEDEAAAVEAAKQRVQLDYLPQQQAIETQGAIDRAVGTERGKAVVELGTKQATRARDAVTALDLISEARRLLPNATGGTLGAAADATAGFFGHATQGAQANAALKTIAGQMTSKMPRMEGPQSDRDVQMYKDMAGDVGNANLPIKIRLAALAQIERLNEKYANNPSVRSGPAAGAIEDGYRFKGGNPADPNNWERM